MRRASSEPVAQEPWLAFQRRLIRLGLTKSQMRDMYREEAEIQHLVDTAKITATI